MVASLFAIIGMLLILFLILSPIAIGTGIREPLIEVGISLALFGPTTLVITLLASRQLERELMVKVTSTLEDITQQSVDIREDLKPLSGNWRELGLTNVYLTRADALREFGEHIVNELSHARARQSQVIAPQRLTETSSTRAPVPAAPEAGVSDASEASIAAPMPHSGDQHSLEMGGVFRRDADDVADEPRSDIRLWIAASSMKGLLEAASKEFDGMGIFSWAASLAREGKIDLKILMTHPEYAEARAEQETRNENSITEEIREALRHLKAWKVPLRCIRMAQATPTVFAIATRERMLLNPYPYGQEAYRSFTLTVRRAREDQSNHPDIHRDIFEQYQYRHFELPWDGAITLDDYDSVPNRHVDDRGRKRSGHHPQKDAVIDTTDARMR